jgi:AraC-like DNA-binding protein
MDLLELIIELLFDVVAIALGLTLVLTTKSSNNQHKFYWGFVSLSIGFILAWENTSWIFTSIHSPGYEYQDILNIEKMLKWFAPASVISLFPLASLRPGYLNVKRFIVFMLPFIIILTFTVCFLTSNGIITEIKSINQIIPHIGRFDVKLRLLIFLFSVLVPLLYFIYPVLSKRNYRKISPRMILFLSFIFFMLGLYTLFTFFINTFIFNAFGIMSVVFAITFSIMYLRSENPLSVYTGEVIKGNLGSIVVSPLYLEMEKFMQEKHPFTDPNYSSQELAGDLSIKEQMLAHIIKGVGFTGFREYINYQRLEYFKVLASKSALVSIKELMFACGFSSKSTFYRLFSERYGITPVKYITNLSSKKK